MTRQQGYNSWNNRGIHLAVAGFLLLLAGCPASPPPQNASTGGDEDIASEAAAEPLTLIVDFGDGQRKTLEGLTWTEAITVFDLLNRSAERDLTVESRGSGMTAFVESIDGVRNERSGRNWIYSVNDERAHVGADAYSLEPGDVVLWKFTAEQYNVDAP